MTDELSFQNIRIWLDDIKRHAPEDIPKMLIGNKNDLSAYKKVSHETAKEFADHLEIPFFECSAKNGSTVEEAFSNMAQKIYKNRMSNKKETKIDLNKNVEQGSGCGC